LPAKHRSYKLAGQIGFLIVPHDGRREADYQQCGRQCKDAIAEGHVVLSPRSSQWLAMVSAGRIPDVALQADAALGV
jgi:hypothetical protein